MGTQALLIAAEGLTVTYPAPPGSRAVTALEDLALAVREGEFVAIIGPSGAGKTTLLRSLIGFVRPTAGQLAVRGVDLRAAGARELYALRRDVAMVFQHFNLVERASALDNVIFGRLGHVGALQSLLGLFSGQDRRLAYDALVDLGMAQLATQRVDRLSGGERQRVAIARALVQQPRIVLADEPAASLDISLTRFVLETLQTANRQRASTVLVNLHDVELARTYATRIVALQSGKLVFDGTPERLTPEILEMIYADDRAGPEAEPERVERPRRVTHAIGQVLR